MATNTPQQPNIEEIRELLSPYLDGEVTAAERARVDSALAESPELQADLASLRQTVTLLASLPVMPAPRPFTLTATEVQPQPKRRFWLPAWAGGLAAAAAAIICVLAVGGGLFWGTQFSGSQSAPAQMVAQQKEAAAETVAKAPAAPAVLATEPAVMKKSIEAQPTAVATAVIEEKAEAAAAAAPPAAPITANQEMMLAQDAVGGAAPAAPVAKSAAAAAPPALAVEVPAEGSVQLESAPMPEQENLAGQPLPAEPATPPAAAAAAATVLPTATAQPTRTALPTPTPPAIATATVTIAPTPVITAAGPVKELPKPASAFNFLSLGGILLFFVLALGVIAVYVFIKGKKQ